MKLTEAERGMLLSKMSDDTVASIFDRRPSWVKKARAWLAKNPDAGIPQVVRTSAPPSRFPKPAPRRKSAGRMPTIEEEIAACPVNFLPLPPQEAAHAPRAAPPLPRAAETTQPAHSATPAPPGPEIPRKVLRWASWFRAAEWTWVEIGTLFEVDAMDLRRAVIRNGLVAAA